MSNKTAAVLTGAALVIGLLTGQALAGGDGGNATEAPTTRDELVITERTKTAAATAAAKYLNAFGQAFLAGEDDGRRLIEAISGEGIRTELLERLAKSQDVAGEAARNADLIGLTAPLGYRVKSYTDAAARIEVWSIEFVAAPEGAAALHTSGGFTTETVDLVWEREAWRLAGEPDRSDGPAPTITTAASAPEVLHAQISDFKEFTHVAP